MILFYGRTQGNSGPDNVNRQIYAHLSSGFLPAGKGHFLRDLAMLLRCDGLLVSGLSRRGCVLTWAAKRLGKTTVYLLHGCAAWEAEGNGRRYLAGTPMLDVHIPAGEPLDTEAALAAMNRAPEFFRRYFHREFPLLHCHSWLLGPELKEVLPEGSRILRFQNLFTVYQTDHLHRQAEERIFGFLSDDAGRYPEGNSLQRAAKGYLLEGKKFSMGAGIRET